MGKILFRTILAMIAGAIAWVVVEPFRPDPGDVIRWGMFESFLMAAWGAMIGAAVCFTAGYDRGSLKQGLREAAVGAFFGCIGIAIGRGLSTPVAAIPGWQVSPLVMIFRALIFAGLGAGLGFGIGYSTFVVRRAFQGLIGGLLGGALAGFIFDPIGRLISQPSLMIQGVQSGQVGEVGSIPRAITGVLLGGAIAMMIGIVEALMKSAWIRLELGRNEGKDWVVDKPVFNIGRSERADIPLFGDPNVAPLHARIEKRQGQFFIVDSGSPLGTGLNGQRIQSAPLNANDVIQIGTQNLRFMLRAGAARMLTPEQRIGQPIQTVAPQPVPVSTASNLQPTIVAGSPLAQPGYSLIALDGPLAGQRFTLPIELGRESTQAPMAFDSSLSRRHVRLSTAGHLVNIEDLQSTNGTYLNGQKIQTATAKPGDMLKIGITTFRIE